MLARTRLQTKVSLDLADNHLTKLPTKTYPRSSRCSHTPPHLTTLTKGMSSCRETCVVTSMWGRAEKSVCRGFAACRARASEEAAR
jgi:hypothetical protein